MLLLWQAQGKLDDLYSVIATNWIYTVVFFESHFYQIPASVTDILNVATKETERNFALKGKARSMASNAIHSVMASVLDFIGAVSPETVATNRKMLQDGEKYINDAATFLQIQTSGADNVNKRHAGNNCKGI